MKLVDSADGCGKDAGAHVHRIANVNVGALVRDDSFICGIGGRSINMEINIGFVDCYGIQSGSQSCANKRDSNITCRNKQNRFILWR